MSKGNRRGLLGCLGRCYDLCCLRAIESVALYPAFLASIWELHVMKKA